MKRTYSQRILSYLMEQEQKNGDAIFNKSIAKRKFRNVKDIHGTVMRRARELASNKMLRRVGAGEYSLTQKGRRVVSQ